MAAEHQPFLQLILPCLSHSDKEKDKLEGVMNKLVQKTDPEQAAAPAITEARRGVGGSGRAVPKKVYMNSCCGPVAMPKTPSPPDNHCARGRREG